MLVSVLDLHQNNAARSGFVLVPGLHQDNAACQAMQ